ncbi:MAG: helix-turn-helix domain-containing protein [Pirellulales bacterium]
MARNKDFAAFIKKKLATNRELAQAVLESALEASIAEQIYNARTSAGLTQAELANRIGSQQSVIARLEDADYEGHSISMLTRVANALGKQVHVVFQDVPYSQKSLKAPPARARQRVSVAKTPTRIRKSKAS